MKVVGCSSCSGGAEGAELLVAALCGELVAVRILPYRGATGDVLADDGVVLEPPQRDQSPAIPESWSPSLLSPLSGGRSSTSS